MGIYDGKHKRCIVCAKKAMRDGLFEGSLCETCDGALIEYTIKYASNESDYYAWIARRVRAHERGKMQTRLDRAFNAGVNYRLVGKP